MRCWIVVLLIVLTAMANPTGGSAQDTALAGSLHAGTCDQVGEVITDLSAATDAAGESVGNVNAVPATSTFSVIPVALETLLTRDHVLIIPGPVSSQTVACGEIGGMMTGDGALIMGLRAEGQSGVTGVAYLVPNDDPTQTNISLFLTGEQVRTSASNPSDSLVDDVAVEQESITDAIAIAAPDDAIAYTSRVRSIIQTMTMSLAGFNLLMDDPQLNNDDWKIKLVVVLAVWQTSYDVVLQITPPPELADEHAIFLEALRLYSEAANSIVNGLETNDSELIDQAADQMDQANELLGQASDRFAALAQGEE